MTPPAPQLPSERVRRAQREVRSSLSVRMVLAAAGALAAVVAAVLLARAGIVDHAFPAYIAGDANTVITSYSGPHWAAAIGLGAVAGVLMVSAVTDGWRRQRMRRVSG